MLNFTTPTMKTMYCVPKRNKLRFLKIENEFPFLNKEWKRYLGNNPIEFAYDTKMAAFKSQLSLEEQNLTIEEITEKYPFWENRVFYFHTEGWLIFNKVEERYYLMKYVEGKFSDILHVCYDCLEEKYLTEFNCSWTRSGGSKKPKKRCKICEEKRKEKRKEIVELTRRG